VHVAAESIGLARGNHLLAERLLLFCRFFSLTFLELFQAVLEDDLVDGVEFGLIVRWVRESR
jgi:hypothetical protein